MTHDARAVVFVVHVLLGYFRCRSGGSVLHRCLQGDLVRIRVWGFWGRLYEVTCWVSLPGARCSDGCEVICGEFGFIDSGAS